MLSLQAGTPVFAAVIFQAPDPEHCETSAKGNSESGITEAEEAAIHNNPLLRKFFQERYVQIFERGGMAAWDSGRLRNYGAGFPAYLGMNSSQRIFRDNFLARQIMDFSSELRHSLEALEASRAVITAYADAAAPSKKEALREALKSALNDISGISEKLGKQFRGILPRSPAKSGGIDPSVILPGYLEGHLRTLGGEVERLTQDTRKYFYSSRHMVTADSLMRGDVFSLLESIGQTADLLYCAMEENKEKGAGAGENPKRSCPEGRACKPEHSMLPRRFFSDAFLRRVS